jgi:hypothetical protein
MCSPYIYSKRMRSPGIIGTEILFPAVSHDEAAAAHHCGLKAKIMLQVSCWAELSRS